MQTKLHLVIWDRFHEKIHDKNMKFFKSLSAEPWARDILFMLRPLGRPPETYFNFWYKKTFRNVENIGVLKRTQVLPGGRTGHCEMWIQVPESLNSTLVDNIYFRAPAVFFMEHKSPVWQPLSDSLYDCQYLLRREGVRPHYHRDDEAQARLLKIIWSKASKLVLSHWDTPLHPKKDWRKFRKILTEMLDYSPTFDPSDYAISHLSVFAINALLKPWDGNKAFLEDHYESSLITRPHLFKSFQHYIKHINGKKFVAPEKKK